MQLRITDTTGYRKLIDFKGLTSDNGVYNLNTDLNFFNFAFGPSGAIAANTLTHLVVTRDGATNAFTGYIDGVAQFSFVDPSGDSLFTGTNNTATFFVDEFVTGQQEASAGFVDYIRTYETPLSQAQVTTLFHNRASPLQTGGGTAPEPGSFALLLSAAPGALTIRRIRIRKPTPAP